MEKMEQYWVKMTYEQVSGFEFAQVVQKIAAQPTDNKAANHVRHIVRELNQIRKDISEGYKKDIVEVYAKRNEKGELPPVEEFLPEESRMEEFLKVQADFGKRECVVKWRALTPETLKDMKLSAKELDLLGNLFTEENGPRVPEFS